MICTFYYKRLVLSYLQNSPANTLSLLSCLFDVLALTEIALINVSCIFCQHLYLLFIAKFSIISCLHFLIQERGPKVTYEINMPRGQIFVDCTDDNDDEHCKPNRRPPTNTEVYVLPSFPMFYYVPYENCVVHVSVMHT
jgi:hypothetical protein